MLEQLAFFESPPAPSIDWNTIDVALVAISGGKDSIASVYAILDEGCPKEKIILVHQRIDGDPTDDRGAAPADLVWDWPITDRYVRLFAEHLGLPLYWQWREGGLSRELYRENTVPAPVHFQHGEVDGVLPTINAQPNTRRKFPSQTASLMTRWCSGAVKIDPLARAITHEPRWQGTISAPKNVAVVTGERAQESAARARYAVIQHHKTSTRTRRVTQYRPVLHRSEEQIWDTLRTHNIRPHPAYIAGFSRTSCKSCIFLTDTLWARLRTIDPHAFDTMAQSEEDLGWTIAHGRSLRTRLTDLSNVTLTSEQAEAARWALEPETFPGIAWNWPAGWFPSGAFQGNAGGSL